MKTYTVQGVTLGEGMPKICVPIVGQTFSEIEAQVKKIASAKPDIVEWRLDHFNKVLSHNALKETCEYIRKHLPGVPLLATFRSHEEGGMLPLSEEGYSEVLSMMCRDIPIDMLDVEVFRSEALVKHRIERCHEEGIGVVGSNHDFVSTPSKEEIMRRLSYMEALGCDIAKMAVMPQNRHDVMVLLEATEAQSQVAGVPLVTMSMSQLGLISRLSGALTGSAMTFASVGKTSAPGQIPIETVREFMNLL